MPYASILNTSALIGASSGHCVWLVNTAGAYTWEASWSAASASADVMQFVIAGNDGANVFLLPVGESAGGTFDAVVPMPLAVPAACVLLGTPAAGGYLGLVDVAGVYVFGFQESATEPGFAGVCYLKVLTVAGGYVTCVAGGTVSYGG